jgi:hypothetical protein
MTASALLKYWYSFTAMFLPLKVKAASPAIER